ncbi:MFS transporter [Gorillibacterium sp. CAU 1737]|uniref:MFS transporter n=1 Tax=Gorillibacterium sp. CAU 1737 TaxID=3140362 RepID=UPI003261030B
MTRKRATNTIKITYHRSARKADHCSIRFHPLQVCCSIIPSSPQGEKAQGQLERKEWLYYRSTPWRTSKKRTSTTGGWLMKTAIWLYLFLFIAMFDLHAQYPILSPFALSLGAVPSFIGLIMGLYSLTHLPGNLLAGYGVDRHGSRWFISASLVLGGILLLLQARVNDPWELLIIRSLSGFALAFLSPASMAMLAKLAKDRVHQSKLMSGNGLIHTLASVVSPAVGAYLVHKLGFSHSFTALGILLLITGVLTLFFLKESRDPQSLPKGKNPHGHSTSTDPTLSLEQPQSPIPWLFFGIPIGLSCAQGILFFELPLGSAARTSILTTGVLFTVVSFGALFSLSLIFLNRFSAFGRTLAGSLALAVLYYGLAIGWGVPLFVSLFLIGAAKGITFPSLAALLAQSTPSGKYGRAFSLLSIAFSIGSFIGPILAGQLRAEVSPYFLAFAVLMLGLVLMPFGRQRRSYG